MTCNRATVAVLNVGLSSESVKSLARKWKLEKRSSTGRGQTVGLWPQAKTRASQSGLAAAHQVHISYFFASSGLSHSLYGPRGNPIGLGLRVRVRVSVRG